MIKCLYFITLISLVGCANEPLKALTVNSGLPDVVRTASLKADFHEDFVVPMKNELIHYGIGVTEDLKSSDIILDIKATKNWDGVYYFKTVDIKLYDGKSESLIAEGKWTNPIDHSWPRPSELVETLLFSIFSKVSEKKPVNFLLVP